MLFKNKKTFLNIVIVALVAFTIIGLLISFIVNRPNSYKLNINKIKSYDENYVVQGTSDAPNGSKIFILDSDLDYGTFNSASGDAEEAWARVENHKFTAYVDPSYFGFDSDVSAGKKLKVVGFALPKYYKGINHDIKYSEFKKMTTKVTNFSLTISPKISKYLKKQKKDEEKNEEEAEASVYVDNYKKDMKKAIFNKLSNGITIRKVIVNGQFDSKPKSMMISAYSSDFSENPDVDYMYIIDAIKVIKKYKPADFDSIKIALYGKVGTPYETKYMPIQSYSIPGKDIKRVIPDNLTKSSLENISTDHYYAHFDD